MVDHLSAGREAYARGDWREAREALLQADAADALGAEDLERLATAAYLVGRDEERGRERRMSREAFREK